jgi:hypothetical protein
MSRYLDFEKQEKGYENLPLSINIFKQKINCQICYVNSRRIDKYRGNYSVEYGVIESTRYNTIYFTNGSEIDIRDIAQAGIKTI